MPLEILHGALVRFRFFTRGERSQVATLPVFTSFFRE